MEPTGVRKCLDLRSVHNSVTSPIVSCFCLCTCFVCRTQEGHRTNPPGQKQAHDTLEVK